MRIAALFALLLCSTAMAAEPAPLVWIDPGHGGSKEGAVGPAGELEKKVTLEIATALRAELESRARARVRLSRESDVDVDLAERINAANDAGAQLFVSVHCNSLPPSERRESIRGVETYFLSAEATGAQARRVAALENAEATSAKAGGGLSFILDDLARTEAHKEASALATAVHQSLVRGVKARDRGVQQAPFVVLSGAKMPAILVEVGFLSNPAEARKLVAPAYQRRVAKAIADGVEAFVASRR